MDSLFDKGRTYTFFFSLGEGGRQITGEVVDYDPPLAKVETEGLVRIINCSSSHFIEAVAKREEGKPGER